MKFHVESFLEALDFLRDRVYGGAPPARHHPDRPVNHGLFEDPASIPSDLRELNTRAKAHWHHMDWQMRVFVADGRYEKAMRWFCWLQGSLWYAGVLDLDGCRFDVHRILNDGRGPE